MRYYLSEGFVLKRIETPCLYDIRGDELYELDEEGFSFLLSCSGPEGCVLDDSSGEFVDYCISRGILTENPVYAGRPPLRSAPAPSLRYLEFQITDKCNLKCRHCYVGESRNREMSISKCKAVLDEFEAMQGLRLLITGGEPLMHSHFPELNRLLPKYGFRKILFSNGLLLNQKYIAELHVDELQISIDGMEHGHDAVRGKGTFRKAVKAVGEVIDAGMQVSVATMVHRENLSEFDEMEGLFRGLGIREWTVDVPCVEGNLKDNSSLWVDPEIGGRFFKYGYGGGLHGGERGFGCGLHLAAVLAGGEICKCAFYHDRPDGNVMEGLAAAWERIRPVDLKALDCTRVSCAVLDECRGGCRFRAAAVSGDFQGTDHAVFGAERDLYKCAYYGIKVE
ncbi:MAG TPA: radical SAM protein [Dissulfurispiraceae bacterium]|nr:radical SAM protein [Dissulfurispiraceae bacterium]